MKKIFLIDGSSMLSTHFYGNPPRSYLFAKTKEEKLEAWKDALQTSDGRYTNAVFGMLKTILKLQQDYSPSHLAVCWDVSRATQRRERYAEYKAHRGTTPSQLKEQFGLMQKVLDDLGVAQYKKEKYEADDLLGTIAARFSDKHQVIILTKDRDALQLINENTTVWLQTKSATKLYIEIQDLNVDKSFLPGYFPFSLESFRIIYGLEPIQIIDLKGLTGDTSDGIPGIEGIGEKTATPLLQSFNTIENFYGSIELLTLNEAKKLLKEKQIKRINPEKMLNNREIALLSKELATIDTNVPGYEELEISSLSFSLDEQSLHKVLIDLEFNSLLKGRLSS